MATGDAIGAAFSDPLDSIKPILIEHLVDEIYDSKGDLSAHYNFLDYYFERDGWRIRARAYADTFQQATWFPPSVVVAGANESAKQGFEADVMAYLTRRFADAKPFSKR